MGKGPGEARAFNRRVAGLMLPGLSVSPVALRPRAYWLLIAAGCRSRCKRVGPDFHPQHGSWSEHWSGASIG
jgi:hypothetical protein